MPHCELTESLSTFKKKGFSKALSRKHMQEVTDVKGLLSEPLRGDAFSSLCSHFVYVQAGNMAANPPIAMTGQQRHSPCL